MPVVIADSMAVRLGVVNKKNGENFFLNRKRSATTLRGNDCSLWVL